MTWRNVSSATSRRVLFPSHPLVLAWHPYGFSPIALQEEATEPAQALQDLEREAAILEIMYS